MGINYGLTELNISHLYHDYNIEARYEKQEDGETVCICSTPFEDETLVFKVPVDYDINQVIAYTNGKLRRVVRV